MLDATKGAKAKVIRDFQETPDQTLKSMIDGINQQMWKYLAMKCWYWWIHTELYDYCSYNIANFLAQCMANWYVSWESKSFSSKNFTYHMFRLLGHTYHQMTLFKLLIKINRLMALHLVQKACDVCYSCSESQM